jgi:hypothetical protein
LNRQEVKEDLGLKRNAENGENAEEDAESLIAWRSWRLGGSYSSQGEGIAGFSVGALRCVFAPGLPPKRKLWELADAISPQGI